MAQRITRPTTDQKIAGSNPAEFECHFVQKSDGILVLYQSIYLLK